MRYIFEIIHDGFTDELGHTVIDQLDDKEFASDEQAIEHAKAIGANKPSAWCRCS